MKIYENLQTQAPTQGGGGGGQMRYLPLSSKFCQYQVRTQVPKKLKEHICVRFSCKGKFEAQYECIMNDKIVQKTKIDFFSSAPTTTGNCFDVFARQREKNFSSESFVAINTIFL